MKQKLFKFSDSDLQLLSGIRAAEKIKSDVGTIRFLLSEKSSSYTDFTGEIKTEIVPTTVEFQNKEGETISFPATTAVEIAPKVEDIFQEVDDYNEAIEDQYVGE